MSITRLKMPIGESDFGILIKNQGYFVDKSLFIKEMLDDIARVVLFTRPRRFGKTLLLSMLRHFFAKDVNGQSTAGLFDGLKINQEKAICQKYQGQYQVIFITFKDFKCESYEEAYRDFLRLVADAYTEHYYLLESNVLLDHERKDYVAILEKRPGSEVIAHALRKLSEYLHRYHKVPPLILIDEYDTPIHSAYSNKYYKKIIGLFRNFLGAALKDNPHCFKGVLTGILRVAKENLFSDLNNIRVYSVLQEHYGEYFGFTDDEVQTLLKAANLEASASDIRTWYNGYQIGKHTLYNPWSLLNCVDEKGILKPYWVNTSGNELVKDCLYRSGLIYQDQLEDLLQSKTISYVVPEYTVFADLEDFSQKSSIFNLLLMAGYLKVVSIQQYETEGPMCELAIPNLEIFGLYKRMIKDWLTPGLNEVAQNQFLKELLAGDMPAFERSLRSLLEETISVFNLAHKPEAFYHGFMIGLTAHLRYHSDYELKSDRESGYGRYDYLILSRVPEKPSLLMEFKRLQFPSSKEVSPDEINTALQKAVDEALQQMENKAYDTEAKRQSNNMLKIAIVFYGKRFKLIYKNEQ